MEPEILILGVGVIFLTLLGYKSKNPVLTTFGALCALGLVIGKFFNNAYLNSLIVFFAVYLFFLTAIYSFNFSKSRI